VLSDLGILGITMACPAIFIQLEEEYGWFTEGYDRPISRMPEMTQGARLQADQERLLFDNVLSLCEPLSEPLHMLDAC
jgi:hypothetical protein